MKTLILIDANSLIHRCFHALPPLTAPDGRSTQALYGISSVLLKMWREEKPDYVAALFDRPEPTFRKEKYKKYKAQRPKAPDELVSQIIESRNLFGKFGIKIFEWPGFEADDLIATLAEKFKTRDLRVVILTGDLDTLQLVEGSNVVVRTFRRGITNTFIYDEDAVKARYGLRPNQMVDYKALVGDPSDNIKGVPGVGPKTASELLTRFDTLDAIYKNLSTDPKIEKKLSGSKKDAEFSKSLVVLNREAPIKIGKLEELKISFNKDDLSTYLESLGFESLVLRLKNSLKTKNHIRESSDRKNKKTVKKYISDQGSMFGDPSISERGEAIFIPEIKRDLDFVKFNSPKLKVGFNLKEKIKNYRKLDKDLTPPYFDLGVAFWLLNPDFKDYFPEVVFDKFLAKKWTGSADDIEDAFNFVSKKLEDLKLSSVFEKIEMPLLGILAEIENFGVLVNVNKLKDLDQRIGDKLVELSKKIYRLAGEEFNINSPQQLAVVLFDKLKINSRLVKKTDGGSRSTAIESLTAISGEHEIVDSIIDYRDYFKLQSTYVHPFREIADKNGRIHTDFVQTGTATGRLSSHSPNLQNIPRGSSLADEFRSAFEAPSGFSLVAFDYSQIELRVLATLTGDDNMIKAFKNGLDIHALTASKILGVSIGGIRPEDRRLAKTLNFGLIYGMGTSAFSKAARISRKEAKEFIEAYFREFSKIKKWQEEVKSEARELGYVKTLNGRRRYLPDLESNSPRIIANSERAAINQPVQGLAADIIKLAMIKSKQKLESEGFWRNGAMMILSVHDELLFEVRDDIMKEVMSIIKKTMEEVFSLAVPLKINAKVGCNWGSLKNIS